MMAAHYRIVAFGLEHECDDRAQAAVAEHGDFLVTPYFGLLENFVGGGNRLGENRKLVGNRVRKRREVAIRQREIFGKGAVAAKDSEHGAVGEMAAKEVDTKIKTDECGINLAGEEAPDEPIVSAGNNFADELVARDTSISH